MLDPRQLDRAGAELADGLALAHADPIDALSVAVTAAAMLAARAAGGNLGLALRLATAAASLLGQRAGELAHGAPEQVPPDSARNVISIHTRQPLEARRMDRAAPGRGDDA